ncbi:MAG: hypothetical protein HY043_02360 [Verrucomicrobia bacterium]|nr:hypothetical protein [Verrucomicrobiota bacterium]
MNTIEHVKENVVTNRTFANACLASCQKLIAQIEKTRDAVLNEFRETLDANEHLLRLALNEAEALAWQTEFPHLVFPTLATEKAQAVAAWRTRQQSIHRPNSRFALAA